MTVVDDGWTTGFLVDEQEEVVTDQLHLVQGLVNGHRLGDVQLAADDGWGVADLDLDGFARAEISGNGVGRAIVRRFRLRLLDDDRLRPGPDRPGPDRYSHDDGPCGGRGYGADEASACREPNREH